MNAIVTDYGHFDIKATFDEFDNWQKEKPIVGDLLREGEIPCGKKIEIVYDPTANNTAGDLIQYCLDSDDWNNATKVILVCNQEAFDKIDPDDGNGQIYTETGYISITIHLFCTIGQ